MQPINAKPAYTFTMKTLIKLYNAQLLTAVASLDIEPTYGYMAQITYHNGRRRYIHGATVDVNSSGAARIATDKDAAKRYMAALGYRVPVGQVFMLPGRRAELENYLAMYDIQADNTLEAVPDYVQNVIGLPCFIKPNDSSRGRHVYQCTAMSDVLDVLQGFETGCLDLILVEAAVQLPEYRVVIYDGALIACYSKQPLTVTGDGHSSVLDLLQVRRSAFEAQGRNLNLPALMPHIARRLQQVGLDLQTVLEKDAVLQLVDASNLSRGGSLAEYTHLMHPDWQGLCRRLCHDMNLRLAGIDLMCADITDPVADYAILEINAAPSLYNYASLGADQRQRVEDLYLSIFNSSP